jgi:anti-anti-sigma factor
MNISYETLDSWSIIKVEGQFVLKNIQTIRSVIAGSFIEKGLYYLAFDLSRVTQLDSSAIAFLTNVRSTCESHHGALVIIQPSKDIETVFDVINFNKNIPIFQNLSEFKESIKE